MEFLKTEYQIIIMLVSVFFIFYLPTSIVIIQDWQRLIREQFRFDEKIIQQYKQLNK